MEYEERAAMRSRFSLLFSGALLLSVGRARAAESGERVRLSWVRGAGASACFDQPTLEAKVVARLGRHAFEPDAPVSIEAYALRDGDEWRASIYVRNADRETYRELRSSSDNCAALEAAVTLAVALVIDPEAPLTDPVKPADEPPRSVQTPPPRPAKPAAPPKQPLPRATLTRDSEARVSASLALRGTVAQGLLPSVAPGLNFDLSLGPNEWIALTASALFLPEQRTDDDLFAFGLTAFGLGACLQQSPRKLLWARLCASAWAGTLHSVVYDLLPTRPGQRFWAAASLAPALRISPLRYGFVELGAEVIVPLVRESFTVAGFAEPVFRQAPVAFRGFAGVGINFP